MQFWGLCYVELLCSYLSSCIAKDLLRTTSTTQMRGAKVPSFHSGLQVVEVYNGLPPSYLLVILRDAQDLLQAICTT